MAEEFNPKNFYKSLKGIISKKDYTSVITDFNKHRSKAISEVEGKIYENLDEGLNKVTEALIKYKQAAKIPVQTDKNHRHHEFHEMEQMLAATKAYGDGRGGINYDAIEMDLKSGNTHKIVDTLVDALRDKHWSSKVGYLLRTKIPNHMAHGDLSKLVKHVNDAEDSGWTDGDMAGLSKPEAFRHYISSKVQEELVKQIKNPKYKAK